MANALAWVSSPSAVSYIIQQDFENPGTPSGWTNFGGCTFHNTVSPLEGTGDLKEVGGATNGAACTLSPTVSEYWMIALLKAVSLPSSGNNSWFGTRTSAFAQLCMAFLASDGSVQVFNVGSLVGTLAAGSVTAGTLYYAKMHFKVGSGANSLTSFELSTSGTWINSGSLYVSGTTGPATSNAGNIAFESKIDAEVRLDHVRMSATDIGNTFSNWT